jgi:hypothetical protein
VAGKAALEKADLEPALKVLKDRLMTKNVVCIKNNQFFYQERNSCLAPCVDLSFHLIPMQRAALEIPLKD